MSETETQSRPARREREDDDDESMTPDDEGSMTSDKDQRTDTSATLQPLTDASPQDWLGSDTDPDVLLSVPNLGIDHIGIKVDNIKADVELHAKVLDLLEIHVGAKVSIDMVEIDIDNVRVQAMLKVKLDKVAEIIDRVMTTIDNNPEILTNLTGGLGKGLEGALQGGSDDSDDTSGSIEGRAQHAGERKPAPRRE